MKNDNLEVQVTAHGFTLWAFEKDGSRHWLVDGSTVLLDKVVRLDLTSDKKWKIRLGQAGETLFIDRRKVHDPP
jgi:hypothetical protein